MSAHPIVHVDGVEIIPGENSADVDWREHLHVEVKLPDSVPSLSCILPSCQQNLGFRRPTPMVQDDILKFSLKPSHLGRAILHLTIIREPDGRNEEYDYDFQLIPPFTLPNQESVRKSCAQVHRDELRNAVLRSISQSRALSLPSPSLRAYCGGMWISGPLCSGKSTLVNRICEHLDQFPFLVLQDTKLYEKADSSSDIVAEAAQGEFLAAGSLDPSDSSFVPVKIRDQEGWVPEPDAVKIRPVKLNLHSLLNNPEYQPLSPDIRVYSEIMKALGVKQPPIVDNGHSQILDEVVRLKQHVLIVLDEFDRMQVVNVSIAGRTLAYLKELVDRVARIADKSGLTLVVIDHKPPKERGLSFSDEFWREHQVGFFSEDELVRMMEEVFENPADILRPKTLHKYTKGHPLLVNLFLYVCVQHLRDLQKPVGIVQLKSLVLRDESITRYVMSWWISEAKIETGGRRNQANKRLTPREKTVLKNLVNWIPLLPGFDTEIASLRSKGLLHPDKDDFCFPLLRDMLSSWVSFLGDS